MIDVVLATVAGPPVIATAPLLTNSVPARSREAKSTSASWKGVADSGSKTEQANAVGKALADAAKKAGVDACVFDRAGYLYHGRVKALAEGAREGGLQF